jgi:hypothetical protein
MKTHNGYYEGGNKVHPDYICERCRKKIQGGMISVGKTRDYCMECFNLLYQASKEPLTGLFKQKTSNP